MALPEYTAMALSKAIRDEFEHWHKVYKEGGSDPFNSDGLSLELINNHITYYKEMCRVHLSPDSYPDEYYKDNPPVVKKSYMARECEIRDKADKLYSRLNTISLSDCVNSDAYSEIVRKRDYLRWAIREDDVVAMRKCTYFDFMYWDRDESKELPILAA